MAPQHDSEQSHGMVNRRSFLKTAAAAVGAGALGSALPYARAAGASPIHLSLVHNTGNGALELSGYLEVIKNFEAKHPDIKVDFLNIPNGPAYYTSINTRAVGNNLPDLYFARTFDVASNAAKGWMIPLDPYINRDPAAVNVKDFWPAEVAQMSYHGQLYTLPYDFSNVALYYNKTMFQKEGIELPTNDWTWDHAFAAGEKFVKKQGHNQTRWGLAFPTYDWYFMGVLVGNGGTVFSNNFKKSLLNSPQNVQTFKYFYNKMAQGIAPFPSSTPAGVNPFASGMVAMNADGSWATESTRTAVGNRFEWDVVKLPKGTTGKRGISAAGGAWGISPTSKYKDQAWEFLKHLTSTESTNILISRHTRSIPGRKSSAVTWQQVAKTSHLPPKNIDVFPDQMLHDAINWTYPAYWNEFNTIWSNRVTGIWTGNSPEQALQQMDAQINEVARRYYK